MQNGILRTFFEGGIACPWRRKAAPNSEKHKDLVERIDGKTKYFTDKMTDEDREKFAELLKLHGELVVLNEADLFAYSFSMGFMWAMDIMRESDVFSNDNDD